MDPFAVAIVNEGISIGLVPRIIPAACSLFLQRSGGTLTMETSNKTTAGCEFPNFNSSCLYTINGTSSAIFKTLVTTGNGHNNVLKRKRIFKGSGCYQFPEAGATTTVKESLHSTRTQFTTNSHCYYNKLW